MNRKESKAAQDEREAETVGEELKAMRRQIVALEGRVARLEVAEEMWQEPGAAGDRQPTR
jgi:predicted  nucleic acid-binding Zn-ribbon protein